MSKLIYSITSDNLESTYTHIAEADQATNSLFRSIAITGDGYLYTHGKKFRLFTTTNDAVNGLSFSITNGTANMLIDNVSIGSGTVVQSVGGDNIVCASTTNGAVSLTHKQYLNIANTAEYGSNSAIPIITLDKYGHITAIRTGDSIDATRIQALAVIDSGNYYLTGVTGTTVQNPVYSSNTYYDADGNLHVPQLYIGLDTAALLFAPLSHTLAVATDQAIGHVKLSDSYDSINDITKGVAITPKALYTAYNSLKSYADGLVAAQDSMIFIGTLDASGVLKSHNSKILDDVTDDSTNISALDYKVGWTLRFTQSGTFQGNAVEVGDMLIAVSDKSDSFSISDWTIIQTNIDGALTSSSVLSGILYGTGSRSISALALSSGVLTSDGSAISFVNKNTLWRDIKVENTSIGTSELNLKGSGNISITLLDGVATFSINSSSIIAGSSPLTLLQGNVEFEYSPSASASLTIGSGLDLTFLNGVYTLDHKSGNAITSKLGYITTDGYGHVTSVLEVTGIQNEYVLKFGDNTNNNIVSYNGSEEKIVKFLNGTDVGLTVASDNGVLTVTPNVTHKYRPIAFKDLTDQDATTLLANNTSGAFTLVAGNYINFTGEAGTLTIEGVDTWRIIQAYKSQNGTYSRGSIGDATLNFNGDFLYSNSELGIAWTEIDSLGVVTYAI